jgi:hypothetical protein
MQETRQVYMPCIGFFKDFVTFCLIGNFLCLLGAWTWGGIAMLLKTCPKGSECYRAVYASIQAMLMG